MALLISAQSLKKSFGAKPLFEGVSLTVNDGDRLGLIGPNGAGKSTFLQILAGRMDLDSGEVSQRKNTRLAYVTQESAFPVGVTVSQVMEAAKLHDIDLQAGPASTASQRARSDAQAATDPLAISASISAAAKPCSARISRLC